MIDEFSQQPMDTDESSHPQQEPDDTEDQNGDDFDSLVHELERQELRSEIVSLLGSHSLWGEKSK
jgi:hypothetical protein